VGVGAQIGTKTSNQQAVGSSSSIRGDTNVSERNGVSSNSSKHSAYLESKGVDKTQQNSMNESYGETTRLEKSIGVHKDNIDAYSQALDHTNTNSSDFNKDMTQEVIGAYAKQYGSSDSTAAKAVFLGSPAAKAVWHQISTNNANELLQQIRANGSNIEKSDPTGDFATAHQEAINKTPGSNGGAVQQFAQDNGIANQDEAANTIAQTKDKLEQTHNTKVNDNTKDFDESKDTIKKDEGRWKDAREKTSSKDENPVVKPPSEGTQGFNINEVKGLLNDFKPKDKDASTVAHQDQYVDASKKVKG